jgi:hypothetical protein
LALQIKGICLVFAGGFFDRFCVISPWKILEMCLLCYFCEPSKEPMFKGSNFWRIVRGFLRLPTDLFLKAGKLGILTGVCGAPWPKE